MAGDPFRKPRPGDPLAIPAEAYGAFVDAALAERRRQLGRTGGGAVGGPGFDGSVVLVKNASGADRGRFEVLGIDQPVILPSANPDGFKERVALSCVTPTADHAGGRFVVLLEPLAGGAVGRAVAAGVAVCQLSVTAAGDTFADAEAGVTATLKTAESGAASILWKEPGTGTRWAVVHVGAGAGGKGFVDLKNAGVDAAADVPFIDVPASSDMLVFGAETLSGTAGGKLTLKPGTSARQVITWNGTKWTADWVRAH